MKNVNYIFQKIRSRRWVLICLSAVLIGLPGCFPESDGEYIVEHEDLITAYLENDSLNRYTEFITLMKKSGMYDLLNSYGIYTCFIPTNEAIQQYYKEAGISSADDLTLDEATELTYRHIIRGVLDGGDIPYESADFPDGRLPKPNMNNRFLTVRYNTEDGELYVNKTARIIPELMDQVRPNGVIHTVNKVLEISDVALPDYLGNLEEYSLFTEALFLTGLHDSVRGFETEYEYQGYVASEISWYEGFETPEYCFIGYTAFVESNQTYAKAGINTIDDLNAYAKQIYDAIYPEDAGVSDVTDSRNSLNRFIAYHLLDRKLDVFEIIPDARRLTYTPQDRELTEYFETMCPNTMLKIQNKSAGVFYMNKNSNTGETINFIEDGTHESENGFIHEIDKILTYKDVEDYVLNERIRLDAAALFPELATNKLRGTALSGDGSIIPLNYFSSSIKCTESTQIHYLYNTSWGDCEGDEFLFVGKYDVTIMTPPLPPGTYEIRFGYTANTQRGVAQIYLDEEPCGIPLNMNKNSSDPSIGWVADDPNDEEANLEVDKMMRNRGYLKGPTSMIMSEGKGSILRDNSQALRRIVITKTFTKTEKHALRIKSVEDNPRQFHLDYLEFAPSHYWELEGID